ncbi:MAG: PIN domain-containing protein [Gemmatimonadetes bacterium]|nr:PIN domain-containing protein [Gemmatimonadota bacterium]
MSARSFFDTNILVYTDDVDSPVKQERALALLADHRRRRTGVLSTQVLQEYFVATTTKLRVDPAIARRKLELFGRLELVAIGSDDILGAIDLHRLHRLSFWEALVVRAALASGCTRLYSEDLQPGWRLDGVTVVNPFTD